MTLEEALKQGEETLAKAKIQDFKIDAFMLLEHTFKIDRATYLLNKDDQADNELLYIYQKLIERRAEHEPCQYIIGKCNFCGYDIEVNENVLIPRQDTEVLVEEALKVLPEEANVLDMCTGSGCIIIALQKFRPDIKAAACDISEEALKVAERNINKQECDINLVQSDLFENIKGKFDLIVSNPPYVTEAEYGKLMEEVAGHEPRIALVAGEDGLDIYKRLIKEAPEYLKSNGILALEIGCDQADDVSELMNENGFDEIKVVKDLAGLDRVVIGQIK